MALQRAPQAVIAAYRDPVLGSWLWLDAGLGNFGSYAAAFWTTEEPGGGPRCCVCGSTAVTYRNYANLPFCGACADGEPLGNMRPCPPSHERNLEESTVLLQLPAYMVSGRQLARLGGDWREVLPGLQARATDEGIVQPGVEFRLTPQGGQDRD
jgi:hypothetical protein